ncbi:MAG TPA: arginine deiminase family protein, partial [Gemmatimonadales bacterium]|nr:arginine deiminase family protein [Gemmatimonadales bacterium]
ISQCELVHLERTPIDFDRAVAQHERYVELLQDLGHAVSRLPAEPDLPDAVFVEDTAVVLDEIAVITRPGAKSRRAETVKVEEALRLWREVATITEPGTLDGGDVLRIGNTLFVGLSSRSNAEGARQLAALVGPFGYAVKAVEVDGCLHLKSAITAINDKLVLVNPSWCDPSDFGSVQAIAVDPGEPFAANVIRLPDSVIIGASYPRTIQRLRENGILVHTVDLSELAKAEGAVTCCSLIFSA